MSIIAMYIKWVKGLFHKKPQPKVYVKTTYYTVLSTLSKEEYHKCLLSIEACNTQDLRQREIIMVQADKYLEQVCANHNFEPKTFCQVIFDTYIDTHCK